MCGDLQAGFAGFEGGLELGAAVVLLDPGLEADLCPRFESRVVGRKFAVIEIDEDAIRSGRVAISRRISQIEAFGQALAEGGDDTAHHEGTRTDFSRDVAVFIGHGVGRELAP